MVTTQQSAIAPSAIINFWFASENKPLWFTKSDQFDAVIKTKFYEIYDQARLGNFDHWQDTAEGILALIIIFDQFSRNMFRNTPQAFATDDKAAQLTEHAIKLGFDQKLINDDHRQFLYMPLMHSENLATQESSLKFFNHEKYAQMHYDIIKKFGRFPHRNNILKRVSTKEEVEFLTQPGSSF
jgi:uncharacterized protein (DUF924 family)